MNNSNTTLLQGGLSQFSTPSNKMGVTVSNSCTPPTDLDLPFPTEFPTLYTHIVKTSQGVKEVPIRLPAEHEIAIVDWVNFTQGIETLGDRFLYSDDTTEENLWSEAIEHFSDVLEHIFGFAITARNATGRNFYKQSYVLGEKMGIVCIGGQRNTILVMLSGQGCSFAKQGWERRLYTYLTTLAQRPRLTRIDIAHDDFDGQNINVDWGNAQDDIGGFQCGNRAPNIEYKGNWKRPNGRGRTLNVGSRESGKYLRIYEKGRAEGDPEDNWQRAEVEFKSVDKILPFDMLLSPSEYFLGAYPCFKEIAEDIQPERIETLKKNTTITLNAAIKTIKHQYGKYITFFNKFLDAQDLINLISHSDSNVLPRRLEPCALTAMRM